VGVGTGGAATGATGLPAGAGTGLSTAEQGVLGSITDVPTIAPSAAGAAKGLAGQAGNLLSKLGITGANAPLLGLQAYRALKGPETSTAEKTMLESAKPLNEQARSLMQFYNSGKLQPADEQKINDFVQQQTAAVNDYWSRAGAPDSSGRLAQLQQVQERANALRDETRQGYLVQALQAAGVGNQATSTLAQLQALGDREASGALTDFLKEWAQQNAYGRYGASTPTVPQP
jgi:hypothetical protein